jgi:hypothetical protein
MRYEVDEVTKSLYPQVEFSHEPKPVKDTKPTVDLKDKPQDFNQRIVSVVRKDLEPWRVANAVAHMQAIVGSNIPNSTLTSGKVFTGKDGGSIPRNSQYPIIIMRADEKELHKLYAKVSDEKLVHHVFIKEMQDTSNDQEIVDKLANQPLSDTEFYGVTFYAPNDIADKLTKGLQLWK